MVADDSEVLQAGEVKANLVKNRGMTVDGNVVTSTKEVEQLVDSEFDQDAEACRACRPSVPFTAVCSERKEGQDACC